VDEVAGVEGDAEKIGGHEAELRGADADHADYGTVDGGNDPALPKFAAQEDRTEDGQDARDVIQANVAEQVCHVVVESRAFARQFFPQSGCAIGEPIASLGCSRDLSTERL
jgi:hypothetical protein